jgi:hypothetical protein
MTGKEGTQFTVEIGPKARLTIGVTEIFTVLDQAVNAQILFAYCNDETGELVFKTCRASELVEFMRKKD